MNPILRIIPSLLDRKRVACSPSCRMKEGASEKSVVVESSGRISAAQYVAIAEVRTPVASRGYTSQVRDMQQHLYSALKPRRTQAISSMANLHSLLMYNTLFPLTKASP